VEIEESGERERMKMADHRLGGVHERAPDGAPAVAQLSILPRHEVEEATLFAQCSQRDARLFGVKTGASGGVLKYS
jgi:hypothetical protein